MKPFGYIYIIHCLKSGKAYVGQTTISVRRRWDSHKATAKRNEIRGMPLYRAIRKYGLRAFVVFPVAVCCTKAQLNKLEKELIASCDTLKTGYNVKPGGGSSKNPVRKTKRQMRRYNRLRQRRWRNENRN